MVINYAKKRLRLKVYLYWVTIANGYFYIKIIREGFNKKKHFFNGIFHKGGGVYPFSIVFLLEKNHFFKNVLKDAQKLLIHPEM
jgi:hypothetical protein